MAFDVKDSALVTFEKADHVAVLTLNSSSSRNALSSKMLEALSQRLSFISRGDDIRVVVVQAEGPVFCAGHDLKELTAHRADADEGRAFFEKAMRACSNLMQQIISLPQPMIAAVDGMATAAGCQLVASCDLAVAGPGARFCTPGVDIGLFCSTPAVALSRNVLPKHAMEMLLTAVTIGPDEASRLGLVNRVAQESARKGALDLAHIIARKSSQAIRIGKKGFYAQIDRPLFEAYEMASTAMVANMLTRHAQEGITAFLDKRAPVWPDEAS
jgi:enoyl-CoA hydratase/carnithine racemase